MTTNGAAWRRRLAGALLKRVAGSSPRNALASLLPAGTAGFAPSLLGHPVEKRVLVLAPHADDDAIGCGGMLLMHVAAGAQVHLAYLTDGAQGAEGAARATLARRREAEARAYAADLGAAGCSFLGEPDGGLRVHAALVDRLHALLQSVAPEVVYVPHPLDTHEDHWQTARALATALQGTTARPRVRGYEVWSPLPANGVADITPLLERKLELIGHFASQLASTDYVRAARGLATYRSMLLPSRSGHAEAFHESSAADFVSLVQRTQTL